MPDSGVPFFKDVSIAKIEPRAARKAEMLLGHRECIRF